ncbi:MAG: VanZ family protein [Verrucomicrobiota bacterium]
MLIWMSLIFAGSTELMSTQRTSRIIGPLLRWINPAITDAAIRQVQFAVRKGAHVAEYAILALLLWRALRKPARGDTRPWSGPEARRAVGIAFLYSVTDEFHQSLVPSRMGTPWDVLLDTCGAAAAMVALWAIGKWRKWWGPNNCGNGRC